ncbi:MAG TPA: hypothetical protein VGM39_04620 [Kofleriaceae bacterium]|jgi:hypothetical protein
MSSARMRWVLLAISMVVLVIHSRAYWFVGDDAYISFVYSRNLAEHGQLAFNAGLPPVEGYTNFLWTVFLAGGIKLGISPDQLSLWGALVCALATQWITVLIMDRAIGKPTACAAIPALLLACSSGFACWTGGGLETQLFIMLVVIGLHGVTAAPENPFAIVRAAVALGLSAMTRPEGLLVAGVFGLAHLYTLITRRDERAQWIAAFAAVAAFLATWAPWFVWRFKYYGYLWPNTYYVKASGRWTNPAMAKEMLHNGVYYLWVWLKQTKVILAMPFIALGLVIGRPRSSRLVLAMTLILLAGAYVPYTISVGGDFMGLHRFIMPLFVVAALALTLGLEWLLTVTQAEAIPRTIVFMAVIGAFAFTQVKLTRESMRWGNWNNDRGIDTPAFLVVYTQDRAAIGKAMEKCFKDDDFSIVGGAGAQPYYGRMRGIDVFGLVSERIGHEQPRVRARAGHTKFATDSLLAEYDPTFVFSCYAITPSNKPPPTLGCGGYWLAHGYEQVSMKIPGMKQQGDLYTFLAKKSRQFQCPGVLP